MKRKQLTFFLAGLIAGLICVAPGSSPLVLLTLTYGVGPAFFVAVLAGIVITSASRHIQAGLLHYLAGLVLCTITYLLALMAFLAVDGFSPNLLGFRPSANIDRFGIDVWLGLISAGVVGASGIVVFTALLTRKWSTSLLLRLMLAGLVTIVVTFIANLPFHSYWSFFGILFPVGNALFCWIVGTQIWQQIEAAGQVAAESSTA